MFGDIWHLTFALLRHLFCFFVHRKMNVNNCVACIFASSYLLLEDENEEQPKKRKVENIHSVWVRDWVKKRETEGCYVKLLKELSNEPKLFKNFLRMTENDFDFLLDLVTPCIEKIDTQMRKSISAGERLAMTLRFLATGQSFKSLQYLFRIPQCTISMIIPEVLDAIYMVLKENYLKVCILK